MTHRWRHSYDWKGSSLRSWFSSFWKEKNLKDNFVSNIWVVHQIVGFAGGSLCIKNCVQLENIALDRLHPWSATLFFWKKKSIKTKNPNRNSVRKLRIISFHFFYSAAWLGLSSRRKKHENWLIYTEKTRWTVTKLLFTMSKFRMKGLTLKTQTHYGFFHLSVESLWSPLI